jgi:hypothetical protein
MEEMLRHYVSYRQNNWDEALPALEHAYNNSVNATINQEPFVMLYGQKPLDFKDLLLGKLSTPVESVQEFVTRMERLVADASTAISTANKVAETYANKRRVDHLFGVGDKVLLSTKYFTPPAYQGRKRKLASKYAGPYEVVKVVSPVAVKLRLPPGTKAHPVFHTSMLKPYVVDPTGTRSQSPPEPVILEGFEEYVVEKVLAERKHRNKLQYLVKWKHYPLSDATWEPLHNVAGNEALLEFQKSRQEPSASERGAV